MASNVTYMYELPKLMENNELTLNPKTSVAFHQASKI